MKISQAELRKIISEEIEREAQVDDHEPGGDHHAEGSMAIRQLNNIGMMSGDLLDLVDDSDNLDEWVEAKITKAHDYLNTVFNHLRGDSVHHVSLAEVEDDSPRDEDEDEEALVLPQINQKTINKMRQGIKRASRPRQAGDFRKTSDRFKN